MSVSVATNTLFVNHTFGRHHQEPAPLPQAIQLGQSFQAGQMGSDTYQAGQLQGVALPEDFDHLVRSVGEW